MQYDKEKGAMLLEKWGEVINSEKAPKLTTSGAQVAMAQLLENQQNYLAEASLSGDVARFEPIIIPVIRRVFPNLIANQLVAVQPMSGPSGLAFALRYHYTGDSVTSRSAEPVTLAYILDIPDATGGNFDIGDTLTGGTSGAVGIIMHTEAVAGHATRKYVVVVQQSGTGAGEFGLTGPFVDGETAGAQTITTVFDNEGGFNFILKEYSGPYTTAEAEKLATDMREMGLGIVSSPITAKSRALKAKYSVEMAQDLRAVHNMDVESELATILSYEVQQEIDREIITAIETQANNNTAVAYDYNTADGRWEQEKYRNLYTKVVKAANQIATATRRGSGNFIIVSANVASAIESLDNFQASPVAGGVDSTQIGVGNIGTLGGRFMVVKDSFRDSDDIVVGYKGPTLADTGIVYSPYVPLTMMTAVGEEDFQPRIGFKTRYAVTTDFGTESSKDYYRTVSVANLPA